MLTPFLRKLGPKWVVIKVININWILWHISQNYGQIRSNVVKKIKKLALSIGLSHILHVEYILKQEVVVVQIPEYLRIFGFEGFSGQTLARIGSQKAKS